MTLELRGVSASYGGATVIHDFNLVVRPREIVTLVGANGAGKSTLVKAISGLLSIRAGTITFDGVRIDAMSTAARMRLGIAHVPEGRQIFSGLSVAENLDLGAYIHKGHLNESRCQTGRSDRVLSRVKGTHGFGRRKFIRRPAADARHRTRSNDEAKIVNT